MSDPNQQWTPPPPPPTDVPPPDPGPDMSTAQTLSGIFFEPGRTFDALRKRPRFLIAALIMMLLTAGVTVVLYQRIDMGQFIRDKMERSSRSANQTEEQKEMGVKFGKILGYVSPLFVPIGIAFGAALYLLGVMAFGGSISYKKSVAVWTYSSLPPAILGTIIVILVLFLKTAETIDPEHLLVTNPGAFMSTESSPVLVAVLSQFDLLAFYGLFLAAIGLRNVAKISSGSAWGIVLGLHLIRAILAIASAAIFGG
jgi:membrane protein, antimicrobial resistance system